MEAKGQIFSASTFGDQSITSHTNFDSFFPVDSWCPEPKAVVLENN
jgi:hypothetical protein